MRVSSSRKADSRLPDLQQSICYILSMSFEKEVEIYSYTLTLLNLTLKVKFPCRLYLEHQGRSITSEVTPTPANKFIFNQEVTLKNDSDKKHIELVVQLLTEKGNKYVGGVVRLAENDLVASEGECMAVQVSKCLDADAVCEMRVDQVATSRVVRKGSPKRAPLRSEYQPDLNINLYSSQKQRQQEGETKSEFNFPISIARKERHDRNKDPMIIVNSVRRGFKGDESRIEKEGVGSMAGGVAVSALEFQVYKEGYNKLKEKYRKETESSRTELNKRLALENNQNNLKLEVMRYKLKAEELEKTVVEKTIKIKELSETITNLQKKQLDSKYLKEQAENKSYTIKSLQQTIKSLNRDNNELKALQTQRYQGEQEIIQSLRDEVDRVKKALQDSESDVARELKSKNDAISKLEYALHNKVEELERAKCNIDDLDKTITNKTFEWEKVLQGERNAANSKQDELKEKIETLKSQKKSLGERIAQLEQSLQDKKNQLSKTQYDKKIVIQNIEVLQKENQQLKAIKDKYIELSRQHKVTIDEKGQLEKAKERETKIKDTQIEEISEKIKVLTETNKKSVKDLQEKLKINQVKLIENDSQNENLKNQLEKLKRQSQSIVKENGDLKNQLKDSKAEIKAKEVAILTLTNQFSTSNNKNNQDDQSSKQEITRLKEEVEKLTATCKDSKDNSIKDATTISQLELVIKKAKVQIQYKDERATRDSNYSKEKISSLEAFKADLEAQIETFNLNVTALKNNEKSLTEKVQKLELEAIKNREGNEKSKKQIKILQQKLQNGELSQKNKAKQFADLQAVKEKIEKRISELQAEIGNLKNDLNKEVIEKKRLEKIVQILQGDLAKAKDDQTKLNGVLAEKENTETSLRDEIKKQKQEYTKLDMKCNGLKKQFDKFKETLTDNLNTVFSSIPEGLANQSRQRLVLNDKSSMRENSDVLNLLISYGREARLNMTRTLDQLKQSIRDNERLNSDYSISMNKSNTAEFQYSQNITQVQQEMAELLEEKTRDQNKYEQEIFLLEGRIKEKDATISDLTEQVEEFDFLLKNNRTEFELYRQETYKKEAAKNKLVEELREQVEYQHAEMESLEHSLEKYQQTLEASELQLASSKETNEKLNKQSNDSKQYISQLEVTVASLKKEIKKTSERCEQVSMGLAHKEEELKKNQQNLQEEERKATELRQFLKVLMRQKEQIIKNQLQKSEKALELETNIEQMKHQIQTLQDAIKASKNLEEEQKETIKKLTRNLKEQETARQEEKVKSSKLADKLKEKERELVSKDDALAKLEDRAKKENEKKTKDLKQLENQVDSTYQKLLATERETSEQILALQNSIERKTAENQKLTDTLAAIEESLFRERTKSEQLRQQMTALQKNLRINEAEGNELQSRIQALNEELRINEEQLFKLQGKINLLEMKLEMRENEIINRIENLNEDWSSKYYSMEEEYEQRLELAVKQRDFLKEKLAESEKDIKKLTAELRSQEVAIANIKKSCEDKVKSLEEDRLATMAEKNLENQRLVDQVRTSFDGLKLKESECRKLNSELELVKANLAKVEGKWRESEDKIRNLNRNYQNESEEMRKKETSFKKLKESITSSQWKAQREVRKVIQNSSRQIIELVDEKSTIRVMEVSRVLQQSILAAIALKLDDKEI